MTADNAAAEKINTSDFSQGSVRRAIVRMAIPMTIGQVVSLLYNLVDRIYIGHTENGRLALTGIGVTLPIISIIIAFASIGSTGGAPLFSMARGSGDQKGAARILGNTCALMLLFGAALSIVFYIFRRPLLVLFGASPDVLPFAESYLSIYLTGSLFTTLTTGLNPFIHAQGFRLVGMLSIVIGAVLNCLLDPVFIYLFRMGVKGAALASVLSQLCSALWVMRFLTGRRALIRLTLKDLRPRLRTIGRVVFLGLSGFCMSLTNTLVQIVTNNALLRHGGDMYVSVMVIINAIRDLASLPATGLNQGALPVLSFNYGARKYGRIREGIRFSTWAGLLVTAVPWVFIMFFPAAFIRMFNSDPALIELGVPAFRLHFMAFVFQIFQLVGQNVSLALGKTRSAIFFSLLRKAFIVTPLTLILPSLWGLGADGVFLAEPVSNVAGGLACYITMLLTSYRELRKMEREASPMPESAPQKAENG